MTEDEFWKLITLIKVPKQAEDYEEDDLEFLKIALSKLEEIEIKKFLDIISHKLYNLDGPDYLENAGDNKGDDSFVYARCWVVAQGQEFYNLVLKNPIKMPSSLRDCEFLLYVSGYAWCLKTGKTFDDWDQSPKYNYENFSNTDLWK